VQLPPPLSLVNTLNSLSSAPTSKEEEEEEEASMLPGATLEATPMEEADSGAVALRSHMAPWETAFRAVAVVGVPLLTLSR